MLMPSSREGKSIAPTCRCVSGLQQQMSRVAIRCVAQIGWIIAALGGKESIRSVGVRDSSDSHVHTSWPD